MKCSNDYPQLTPLPWLGWVQSTPVIPTMYWDVYSEEQRIKYLCCLVGMLLNYCNTLGNGLNEIHDIYDELTTRYDNDIADLNTRVSTLEEAFESIVTSMLIYDPTKGKYTASIDQTRRMLQLLSQPDDKNLTVQNLAESGLTVHSWAESYMCGTVVNDSFKRMLNKTMPVQEVG